MSTTFRCAGGECGEKLELPLHYLMARNEAYRRGWQFRGHSVDGVQFFCPSHPPAPTSRRRPRST